MKKRIIKILAFIGTTITVVGIAGRPLYRILRDYVNGTIRESLIILSGMIFIILIFVGLKKIGVVKKSFKIM